MGLARCGRAERIGGVVIRSITWNVGAALSGDYTVAAVRTASDGAKTYHARHSCGRARWQRRGEVLRHLNGERPFRCPRCAPLQSIQHVEREEKRHAPRKACKTCYGLVERRQAPVCPECQQAPARERRTS